MGSFHGRFGLRSFDLGPLTSVRAESGFDTAAAPSEQTGMNSAPPQIVGAAAGDLLTVASQRNTGSTPASAVLTRFRRSGTSFAKVWEKPLPLPRLVGMTSDGTSSVRFQVGKNLARRIATALRPTVRSRARACARPAWPATHVRTTVTASRPATPAAANVARSATPAMRAASCSGLR
jgi:hypothetical protein